MGDDILTPDFVFHGLETCHGSDSFEGLRQVSTPGVSRSPFYVPGRNRRGERVACRFSLRATQEAEFVGVRASHNKVPLDGIVDLFRLHDNRMAEIWVAIDTLEFIRQIGALPSPTTQAVQLR